MALGQQQNRVNLTRPINFRDLFPHPPPAERRTRQGVSRYWPQWHPLDPAIERPQDKPTTGRTPLRKTYRLGPKSRSGPLRSGPRRSGLLSAGNFKDFSTCLALSACLAFSWLASSIARIIFS